MGKIMWNTDVNAPCCPGEIVEIREDGTEGRSRLIDCDWEFPGVASSFGWSIAGVQRRGYHERGYCEHDSTDGTVACKQCGTKAGDFIAAAYDWLLDNDGATADDPGYFSTDEE